MSANSRPSLFIGSSREQLRLATGIQQNLQHDFETTVWNQGVFKASAYPLDDLAEMLDRADVGVFVLVPDDFVKLRGHDYLVPRDNVILELGMFIGKLGRERSFMLVPQGAPELRLPSDLLGLNPITYDSNRKDRNLLAALGPACTTVRDQIAALGTGAFRRRYGLVRAGLFPDFNSRFDELLQVSTTITTFFIHSRRWRENNNDRIKGLLSRPKSRYLAYLPDLSNVALIATLADHFDDGPHIPGFIADGYRYFAALIRDHPGKVEVELFQRYLTHTAYVFDDKTAILAMYPTTTLRKSPPTFEVTLDAEYGVFVRNDLAQLTRESRKTSQQELVRLASKAVGGTRAASSRRAPTRGRRTRS